MSITRTAFITFLINLAISSADDKLSLSPSKQRRIESVGNSFFVTCRANGKNVQRVMWTGPENKQITDYTASPVQYSKRERIYIDVISTGEQGVELYNREVQMKDRGTYTCSANVDGREVEKSFDLIVHKIASFDGTPKDQFLEEGKNSTLQCIVDGDPKPTVYWRDNKNQLIGKRKQRFKAHPDNKDWLIVYNVTREDAGKYTCWSKQLTTDFSEVKKVNVEVNVNHKPFSSMNQSSESFSFVTGVVNLTCEAMAQPEAKFTWLREGVVLEKSDIYEIFDEKHKSVLQINVENEQMFGYYDCKAQNHLGTFERVVILEKGKQPAIPDTKIKHLGENQFTLEIRSKNQPEMPIVAYKVEYKRKHDDWNAARYQEFKSGKPYIITGLQPDTVYVIRASAQNVAGLSAPSREIMRKTRKTSTSGTISVTAQFPLLFLTFCVLAKCGINN